MLSVFDGSIDGSVRIEGEDRAGLERLVRYCARGPLALERLPAPAGLEALSSPEACLVYRLPEPDVHGRQSLRLTSLELLERLARLVPPPRIHRHRYHGVLAPNARLRSTVVSTSPPSPEIFMNRLPVLAALAIALLFQPWQASAQTWSPEQQEVWAVVQSQWQASMAKDTGWMERFLHPDFRGRTVGETAPRDKQSASQCARYEMESGSTVLQDLVPKAIVVHGGTAVVHHHYSQAQVDREG